MDDVANRVPDEYRERELKFDVPTGWTLPDPSRLVPDGSLERASVHLETTYLDTEEHDLLRSRLTLRRRLGDTDTGWHLKVPDGDARTEIRLPADGDEPPAELQRATLGVRRGAPLQPIAELVTEREIHRLAGADHRWLAEIAVDAVTAMQVRDVGVTRRWREVEVELVDGDEELLRRAADWLVEHGATPSASASKLARAVDTQPRKPRDRTMLSGLIGDYLDVQADALIRGDIALRRGHDLVHRTRVATRRYRSVLRVLRPVFDPERAAALDAELAWYAAALGAVRDGEVLRAHLDDAVAELPPELVLGPVRARLHETLAADQREATDRLSEVLDSERYFALLAQLGEWREQLPVLADEPAEHVEQYLRKARRKVRRRISNAPAGDGRDAALHGARKAAKRARYIAELAEPELGKPARKIRKTMKQTQNRLGLRQDRIVAAQFLRRVGAAAGTAPGENGFTYGLLYERELTRARAIDG